MPIRPNANGYKALVEQIGPEKARKLAYRFHSQVEMSLIKGDFPAQLVLFKILLDELHIFLGVGNHIFDGLHKALIEDIDYEFHETCYKWAEDNSLVGLKYRGGQLDGYGNTGCGVSHFLLLTFFDKINFQITLLLK